jgi:hypothetical protein
MLTRVKINSVDVTSYLINYEKEDAYGDTIAEVELNLVRNVKNVLTIDMGMTLEIWRGWGSPDEEKIFNGYVESYNPEGGKVKITGKDKLWDLVRREVTHIYDSTIDASAGKISEIFKDLVTTYGGLNADATSIQDSGTGLTIGKFICNHTDIMERCKTLKKILDWQFYYRTDTDKVYFEPQGFTTNSTILTVGNNIIEVPKWTYDTTEMVNDLTVVGAFQEIETTETGRIGSTSGYNIDSISINFEPISVKVYIDTSNPPNTLKTGGLPDSTVIYDYYVDKNQKKILPAVGTNFIMDDYAEIRYSRAVPIPVHMYNQASIDKYGDFRKTVTYKDLRNVADAEIKGANYLSKYSSPFILATLKVKNVGSYNLKIGQMIRVIDSISSPNVDGNFIISRHRIRYPSDYDEIVVGDKAFRLAEWQASVEERIKRINEDEIANQDMITELITIDNSISNKINVLPRYFIVNMQNMTGTGLIWGNPTFGIWGTYNWSDGSGTPAEAAFFIQQYNNNYEETFYDTDFDDTGNTTANWDITNKRLDFSSLSQAQSTSIDYNNGVITKATLIATIASGNYNFYVSANGGANWESTSSGVSHTLIYPGIDLRWRIRESAGVTGRITKLQLKGYH